MKAKILIFVLLICWQKVIAQPNIEHITMVTTPIILLKGDTAVGQGTGFFYGLIDTVKKGSVIFLVTNYHVLTGSAPNKNKKPIGDNIIFYFHKDDKNTGNLKDVRYPLYTKDGEPIWITSKTNPDADVAIIPLISGVYQDCMPYGISEDWTKTQIKLRPTTTVTLVGYPYGFKDSVNALPIWKTGSIASEPSVNFSGKPLFIVDVSAFPGMSGSPVFAIVNGAYESDQGGTVVGNARKFLGIYSSMESIEENKYLEELQINKKEGIIMTESLQLGHVWKAQLIIDIVKTIDIQKYEKKILRNLR